jgi:hypothetical protein
MSLITDESTLDSIDLDGTMCPPDLNVEIEGYKPMRVMIPHINLIGGICHVLVVKTAQVAIDSEAFRKKIKLLTLDQENRYIKVRIS